jgi:uncharacterized protein involved in exopolysaccharide biosynthesis
MQDSDIIIDGALLREAAWHRLRTWLVIGPVIFIAVAGYQLLRMPQSYTASVSISVQQGPGGGSSPLALLTGGGASKKYIGILRSRTLAEAVESKVRLRQFYRVHDERAAASMLMESIKPEDNASEGLLYLHLTLNGPPRYASDPDHKRERVKQLVADVANEYATQLRYYYATSDNDRDSVLLSAAEGELQRARADYDRSSANIRAFVADLRNSDSLTAPASMTEGPTGSANGLQSLYDQLLKTEASIRGAEAAQQAEIQNTQRRLGSLASIPGDDPFLGYARRNLNEARYNLNTLIRASYLSDENPRVVSARKRVQIAAEELQKEEEGYREGLTTTHLEADARLQSLRAQRDSIQDSIRKAESRLPTRRERTTAMIELEKEQEIALTVLKATEEKYAELRMSAPSANSRMTVVDSAIPPETGQPGLMRAGLIAFLIMALPFFPTVLWDYLRRMHARVPAAQPLAVAPHTNGIHPADESSNGG